MTNSLKLPIERLKSGVIVFLFLVLFSCSNNTEELAIDCSLSDLAVEITESIQPDCAATGTITVTGSGGTAPYTFSINGLDFQTQTSFSNLSASEYVVSVKDADGCTNETTFNLIGGDNVVALSLDVVESSCSAATGSVTVTATGGDGNYTYSLGNNAQSSNAFTSLSVGTYQVTVTDGEGCDVSRQVLVPGNVSLENQIMPIIMSDCAISGCHNGAQTPNLLTAEAVIANASRIKSETQARSMPRGRTLRDQEIELIACWVDSGAPNN